MKNHYLMLQISDMIKQLYKWYYLKANEKSITQVSKSLPVKAGRWIAKLTYLNIHVISRLDATLQAGIYYRRLKPLRLYLKNGGHNMGDEEKKGTDLLAPEEMLSETDGCECIPKSREFDISEGDITINQGIGDAKKITVFYGQPQMTTAEFDPSQRIIIKGSSTKNKVIVACTTLSDPLKITLQNLSIERSEDGRSEVSGSCAFEIQNCSVVELTLEGENKLVGGWYRPGLGVAPKAELMITKKSSGSLFAGCAGQHGAGIGGYAGNSAGSITINGGTIRACGGRNSAGIGGSLWSKGAGAVTINGGTVDASNSDSNAAGAVTSGIQGSLVTINGGIVNVGGGDAAIGGNTVVSQGVVNANGRNKGIAGNLTCTGGTITATGSAVGIDCALFTGECGGDGFIIASSIANRKNEEDWNGVIFQGSNGSVYGSPILKADATVLPVTMLTIEAGKTLIVDNGITLTNHGIITIDGTLINYGKIINNIKIEGTGKLINHSTICNNGTIEIDEGLPNS